jgi:surfactin synthase thioesterase subunit
LLPGRERRILEPLLSTFDEIIAALAASAAAYTDVPYVLTGQSMGALEAFELARRLEPSPAHLIVISQAAPHRLPDRRSWLTMSDDEVLRRLAALGGFDAELLKAPDFMSLVLPIVRADLIAYARYSPAEPDRALSCPITAVTGHADPTLTAEDAAAWGECTCGTFRSLRIEGGHMLVQATPPPLLATVEDALDTAVTAP